MFMFFRYHDADGMQSAMFNLNYVKRIESRTIETINTESDIARRENVVVGKTTMDIAVLILDDGREIRTMFGFQDVCARMRLANVVVAATAS